MTEPQPHLAPADEADLVALADGNLSGCHRVEVEARVAREPDLAAALERQRCALSLLAQLTTPAPVELRVRVAELRSRRRRLRLPRRLPVGLAAAAATAAMLLMVAGGAPVPEDVAAVALRPATARVAPAEQIDGARFPRPAAWRAVGTRSDVVEGRAVRTVFYERGRDRVAYTIVSGPALERGRRAFGTALTWVRDGHTCVVSGRVSAAVLAQAAKWRS